MTWTLRAPGTSKLGVGLLFSCLVACAGILGIEDRTEDTAANYPSDGYEGCRDGDCTRCLDVHRQACEALAACADSTGKGECAACVCQNCLDPLATCQQDEGCTAIWECLRDSRCDLSERAQASCTQSCGTVIQANGGVNGHSFRAAADIRTCATTSACLSCLAPQVTQSSLACTQQDGCQDCPDCFNQCLCSGEKFGDCKDLCKDQGGTAPPAACSDADQCAGCTTCLHTCSCNGGTYQECVASCSSPPPVETTPPDLPAGCSAADGCAGCKDCVAQCECSGGGDESTCRKNCAPPSSSNVCIEDPRGVSSSCDACESCVAQHTCQGEPIEAAWRACDVHSCDDLPNSYGCAGGCNASDPQCFEGTYGSCGSLQGDCESCACQTCPGELGTCKDTDGCEGMFQCMRSTGCQGSECLERCRDSGAAPESFAYAEALWACYQGSGCGTNCSANVPPPPIECPTTEGSTRCSSFVGVGTNFPACCPGVIIYPLLDPGSSGTTVGDDNPCGLDMGSEYSGARLCEPLAQTNPPRYGAVETCPDTIVGKPPYNGAILTGCCRGADNTCGYYDDITGLGCLSAGVFGDTVQACP